MIRKARVNRVYCNDSPPKNLIIEPLKHRSMLWAKLGRELYLGSAGGVWARGARVAWGITGVSTLRSGVRAGLLTIPFSLAVPAMAYSFAAVKAARQQFITDQTTRNILQVAWDITSLLERKHRSKKGEIIWGGKRSPLPCFL